MIFSHIYNTTKDNYVRKDMNYTPQEVREGMLARGLEHLRKNTKDVYEVMKSKDYIEY